MPQDNLQPVTLQNTKLPVFCVMNYLKAIEDDKYLLISRLDWVRVGNFLRGHWPQPTPEILLLQEGCDSDLRPLPSYDNV